MKRQRPVCYAQPCFSFSYRDFIISEELQRAQNLRSFKYLRTFSISRKITSVTEVSNKSLYFFCGMWLEVWNSKTMKLIRKFPNVQSDSLKLFNDNILIGVNQRSSNPGFFCIRLRSMRVEMIYTLPKYNQYMPTVVRCFDYLQSDDEEKIYYVAHDNRIYVYDMRSKGSTSLCEVVGDQVVSIKTSQEQVFVGVLNGIDNASIKVLSRANGMPLFDFYANQSVIPESLSLEEPAFGSVELAKMFLGWKCKKDLTHRWAIPVTDALTDFWLKSSANREYLEELFSTPTFSARNSNLASAIELLKRADWFIIPVKKNGLLLKIYLPEKGFLRKIGFLPIKSSKLTIS